MQNNLECINHLIGYFQKLPGVGFKTAERYAYKIVESDASFAKNFCDAIMNVKDKVSFCKTCGNFSEGDTCDICKKRGGDTVCVVKDPRDVIAIEKSGGYVGTYHVLHGVISPLEKRGPDDLNIKSLLERVKSGAVKEIIIATNPDVEGEVTANYLTSILRPLGVRVTRIAQGIAAGTNLEYADQVSLSFALKNRVNL